MITLLHILLAWLALNALFVIVLIVAQVASKGKTVTLKELQSAKETITSDNKDKHRGRKKAGDKRTR